MARQFRPEGVGGEDMATPDREIRDHGDIREPLIPAVERPGNIRQLFIAGISLVFIAILCLTIIYAFVNIGGENWKNAKELLQVLLPVETALIGSAIGYYFGTQR